MYIEKKQKLTVLNRDHAGTEKSVIFYGIGWSQTTKQIKRRTKTFRIHSIIF